MEWSRGTIASYDAVVIATAHREVRYDELAEWAQVVIDTRNAMSALPVRDGHVWKA